MTPDQINDHTSDLIRKFGREVAKIGEFEAEMVCVEGMIAGLIAFNALRHNRNPEEVADIFCDGLRERLTRLLYGEKQ